ncbi:hypothetical protein EDB81DRAFT_901486 [Dactylonectria macrodidyma]|uniref:Uncharacterized protein n=1 Tax=Dactylonectria macrodidyma TaxID=307937 RepID=A0A9P9EH80_9HYPO|nr:hypothetical protein EDB81DRAFT_901486 [Dactylonectria macrodidyma]
MSVGSLTTTFTPAASCVSSLTDIYADEYGAMYGGPLTTDGCFPAHYAYALTNYYSPGICPDGYTTACSSTTPVGEGSAVETVVTCCPSNFDCNPKIVNGWESTMGCSSAWADGISFPTVTIVTTSGTDLVPDSTTSMDQPFGALNVFSVQIRFRDGDFHSGHEPTNTDTASTTASTSPADNKSHSVGLSAGEVAGIGIGSAIGVLGLAASAYCIFLLGKRQARWQFAHTDQAVEETRQHPQEVSEHVPNELPTTSPQVPELPPGRIMAEMPEQHDFGLQARL